MPLLMLITLEATGQPSVEETRLPKLSHVHVWLILYVKVVRLGENRLECRRGLGAQAWND